MINSVLARSRGLLLLLLHVHSKLAQCKIQTRNMTARPNTVLNCMECRGYSYNSCDRLARDRRPRNRSLVVDVVLAYTRSSRFNERVKLG